MYSKIARINVYNKTEEEYKRIKQEINEDIKRNNIKAYRSDYGFTEPSWGNYCMYGLPYEKATEYAEKYNLTVDAVYTILQRSDIENLKVGDKVQYTTDSIFGKVLNKGTVYDITDDTITIRLYRKRNKGHILKVGQVGMIRKGWSVHDDVYKEMGIVQ